MVSEIFMSFARIREIREVDVIEANHLIEAGCDLLQIVPGWTSDNTPCTLFYFGVPKVKSAESKVFTRKL